MCDGLQTGPLGAKTQKRTVHCDAVTVIYKWTTHPGKLNELKSIYGDVTQAMKDKEPDTLAVHCHVSKKDNALPVRDEFKDAAALGLHLSTVAAGHFSQLLAIATPGPFLFQGDVPQELQQATEQMQLGAEFATHALGFDRQESGAKRRCDRRGASAGGLGTE